MKALINVIEQYRILHAHNTIVESCVGFVFPRNMEESCVTKVEVKFVDFYLIYIYEPFCKRNVSRVVREVLRQGWSQCMPFKASVLIETTTGQNTGSTTQELLMSLCVYHNNKLHNLQAVY